MNGGQKQRWRELQRERERRGGYKKGRTAGILRGSVSSRWV